ncbi:coth protein-domain-containing protein [Neocallimastix sp. 'constans']
MKKKTEVPPWSAQFAEDFETMNATMEFFVPGTDYRVELESGKFKFAIGGKGSRNFSKPGYNIKLEEGSIYEVKNLRLRSNSRDPTLLREKLSTDMLYKMGLPTTSTNFVNLEVNGEDLGLYIVTNKIRKDFIKRYFNDKNTDNLFECLSDHNRFETYEFANSCQNAKEELAANKEEIINFNNAINNATSVEDIEKVLDVDNFLRYIAYEFLTLSWDHFLGYNHNFFWYKKKEDGRFIMILNDFDETFGADFSNIIFLIYNQYADRSYMPGCEEMYVPNTAFRDIDLDHKIMKYLVHDDDTRFRRIIGEVVKQVFNPKVLNARIDELAELIHDDMVNSRSIDEKTGYCRGCFNTIGLVTGWNITHFEDGVNYGNWISNASYTYSPSLKFFIEGRFKYICHTYGIDPETLELIEPQSYNADPEKNNKPVNYEYTPHRYDLEENKDKEDATVSTTVADIEIETSGTTTVEATSSPSETVETIEPVETSKDCWSEKLGYSCCQTSCDVYESDANGDWGYENQQWCGILKEKCTKN